MKLYDSSMDYSTREVIAFFDEAEPTREEVCEYVERNYGFTPENVNVYSPTTHKGMINPGVVYAS